MFYGFWESKYHAQISRILKFAAEEKQNFPKVCIIMSYIKSLQTKLLKIHENRANDCSDFNRLICSNFL